MKNPSALAVGISEFAYSLFVCAYKCIPLLTGSSILCVQRIDHNNICMLWVVDGHPEWKELVERVFDHEQV